MASTIFSSLNFWLLDILSSLLVLMSAWYGKSKRHTSTEPDTSDSFKDNEGDDNTETITRTKRCVKATVFRFVAFILYLLLAATSVILFRWNRRLMVSVQFLAMILCVVIVFLQWMRPRIALCIGALISILSILSASTSLQWVLNDLLIAVFALLASYVRFQNFAFLQAFLWIAVIYDICLCKALTEGLPHLFSIGTCNSVLRCQAFEAYIVWQPPILFAVKFGPQESHVFLGVGDIIIGCIIANFSQAFFRSFKHLSGTVMSYALALALLTQVDKRPFPALVTIVPLSTLQLIISAVISRKLRKLFSIELGGRGSQELELLI